MTRPLNQHKSVSNLLTSHVIVTQMYLSHYRNQFSGQSHHFKQLTPRLCHCSKCELFQHQNKWI